MVFWQNARMQKWEYLTEEKAASGDFKAYLKEKGDLGWELCVFTTFPDKPSHLLIVFKRPKQ